MLKRFLTLIMLVFLISGSFSVNGSAVGEINLALGKTVTVESYMAIDNSYAKYEPKLLPILTDGQYANGSGYYEGKWAHFTRGDGRYLDVDLERLCTISRLEITFLHNSDHGVYAPLEINVFVSADGINYVKLDATGNKSPYDNSYSSYYVNYADYTITFDSVCARYVRIGFDVYVNSFCDELEIFGLEGGSNALSADYYDFHMNDKNSYADRNSLGGVHDIVCFHAGYSPDNTDYVNNTEEDFLPYVAYVDKKGVITDTMFDSVMFLTLQGKCPSGGSMLINGDSSIKSDWEYLLDNYFSATYNLSALNRVYGKVKEALELDAESKYTVYLTVPYPKISQKVFGDIDGDGIDDVIKNYNDCIRAIEWFMDEAERRFDSGNYSNLNFAGFFYFSESLTGGTYSYEYRLAKDFITISHNRGKQVVAIPFYQAGGMDRFRDLDFDTVLLQPNLSFYDILQEDPENMMNDFTVNAKKYGFGVQIEMNDSFIWEEEKYGPLFEQYLTSLSQSGMMTDTVHAYYNGAGPGRFHDCTFSDSYYARWMYDSVYRFIKGTLSLNVPEYRIIELEINTNGERSTAIKLDLESNCFWQYKQISRSSNGYTIVAPGSNTIRYVAPSDYQGETSFEYEIYNGTQLIYTIKAALNTYKTSESEAVVPEPSSELPVSQTESDIQSMPDTQDKPQTPTVLIVGICSIAVLAVASVMFVLIKNKKQRGK